MQRRKFLKAAAAVASVTTFGIIRPAAAAETTIRLATLAPPGSTWMRVFNAWNNSLQKATGGQVKLHFYAGGSAGDERDAVRKMRAGQVDGAALTAMGLGQIVRSALVLQAPGVCTTYKQIDAVRATLADDFKSQFDGAGFTLLGWNDAGQSRVFSNRPVVTPDDMRQTRMWAWRDNPAWESVPPPPRSTVSRLALPEVYPALRTNRIDAFPGTTLAAVAFQWYTKASHVTKEPNGVVVGATVINKSKFSELAPEHQKALIETSTKAHAVLATEIRKDDTRAYSAIVGKGVTPVSVASAQAVWDSILKQARDSMVGKIYSAEQLRRVEQIARSAG